MKIIFLSLLLSAATSFTFSPASRLRHHTSLNVQSDIHSQPMTRVGATPAPFAKAFSVFSVCAALVLTGVAPANAEASRTVGQISGSGLVFKDTLNIESFADPKIPEVSLYISNFQRPITERISSGGAFFNDPSFASVGCVKTSPGKVTVSDKVNKNLGGEEVFEEAKSILFKTLRVQRVYDTETNTVVYVSFNTRLDKSEDSNKSRFKSSICAVNLND
ncbi:hypothetical protein TrLO_g1688 [Triparma laevis f. longispina]|uniref:Uncharacterized protein n=1 Tax=Triparma laevis f. longispina TaxID=1714387 RepID=A0A9W7FRR1_9STRA|nr:hypothetical protein TrLO_g1688 [Triparma laevis f. longispina]